MQPTQTEKVANFLGRGPFRLQPLNVDTSVVSQGPVPWLILPLDMKVSSAYLMRLVLSWVETQSQVYRVKSQGLRQQPCGGPVLIVSSVDTRPLVLTPLQSVCLSGSFEKRCDVFMTSVLVTLSFKHSMV